MLYMHDEKQETNRYAIVVLQTGVGTKLNSPRTSEVSATAHTPKVLSDRIHFPRQTRSWCGVGSVTPTLLDLLDLLTHHNGIVFADLSLSKLLVVKRAVMFVRVAMHAAVKAATPALETC